MNISEIREKYPQYSDLSDAQLAEALYQKFQTNYGDMSLAEFSARIGVGTESPKQELARGSFIDPLAQGATLGFSDELAGVLGATVGKVLPESMGGIPSDTTWNQAYKGIRGQALKNKQAFEDRNPAASTALELGGGLLTGGVGAGRAAVSKAVTGVPKYLRYAGAGAAPGAIAGAGYADQGNRTKGAVTGAAIGAGTGVMIPAVANSIKGVAAKTMEILGRSPSHAERKIVEALARDGATPEQIARRLQQRPGSVIPDVAGENTRGLARAAAAFPGKVKNDAERFLNARQYGSGDRVKQAMLSTLSDSDDVLAAMDRVNASARARATPLYKQAHATPIELTDELQTLLKRPSVAKAFENAKRIAAEEGEEMPQVFKIEGDKVVDILEVPNMKAWDYIKRGLDDVIEGTKDQFGRIRGNVGYTTNQTKQALIDILDDQNPAYKEARKVWSSKMRYEEALQKGEKLLNADADVSQRVIAKMQPEELEMFRIGVAKAIRTKINKMGDGFDVGRRIFGNKDIRQKLEMAFPNKKEFNDFKRVVLQEMQQSQTRSKVLGNSVTARLEGEKADLMVDPTMVANLAQGRIGPALQAAAGYAMNRAKVPTETLGNNLTQMLFNPAQQQALLANIGRQDPNALLRMQRINAGLLGGANAGIWPLIQ